MTLGPVLAGALASLTTRPWALYVGGLDVIKEPATPARYSVDLDSVRLISSLWDAVGSLDFTISDAAKVLSYGGPATAIAAGQEVRLVETRAGVAYPWFLGYATEVEAVGDFGDQGRKIRVKAASIDAVLDWTVTARDLTFPIGAGFDEILMVCLANTLGMPEVRAFSGNASPYDTTADMPIGSAPGGAIVGTTTIPAGTSIRACARYAMGIYPDVRMAIDQYRGLRTKLVVSPVGSGIGDPWPLFTSQYNETPGTITIPGSGDQIPLNVSKKWSGVAGVRAVAVKHPTLVTETAGDGSGLVGPSAVISSIAYPGETQSSLATEATRYLAMNGFGARGRLTLDSIRGDGWNLRPMSFTVSPMAVTVASLDMSSESCEMAQIESRFFGGGADYAFDVYFGVQVLSGAQKLRSLTRGTY